MFRYQVPDMSCNHCVKTITDAIRTQDASAQVNTDLDTRTVSVQSTTLSDEALRAALSAAGYPPAA